MKSTTISVRLQKDSDSNWYFAHIPIEVRTMYKPLEKRGIIAVTAKVGSSAWRGSLLPWADGSAQISIPKRIREKQKLSENDEITLALAPYISS